MIFDRALKKSATPLVTSRTLTLESIDGWNLNSDNAVSSDKAMKNSAVTRCVEVLSNAVAELPVYVMDENTKERKQNHDLGSILWGRPNEAMTSFDYERLMESNRLLSGNAYAWIHRSNRSGRPIELIALDPDCVDPYVHTDGRLWYIYTNPRTGEMIRIFPEDMLHYKAYSKDGIEGISVLSRAAMTIRTGLDAQKYQSDIYRNGGRPSGILKTEADIGGTVDETDAEGNIIKTPKKDLIRREWERIHNGTGNAFRVAVLDKGLEYKPISMSLADAQFVESDNVRVLDICRFFGVSPHLVFAGNQSYNANELNSLEFTRFKLQPIITAREQEDSYKLLLPSEREQGLRIKREMKVFLRGDTKSQAEWYRAMREVGVYSVNDIRALEDLGDVEGGDVRYASWNYGPLEEFAELSKIRALGGKLPEGESKNEK